MECLADFGTVSFFSVSTLTTGIYNSWLSFDDLNTANQLSFFLVLIILLLFIIENYSRGNAKYHHSSLGFKPINKIRLVKAKAFLTTFFCATIFFISFIFPSSQMAYWTFKFPKYFQDLNLISLNINTLILVILSSIVLVSFSFLSNFGSRISKSKILNNLNFCLFRVMPYQE